VRPLVVAVAGERAGEVLQLGEVSGLGAEAFLQGLLKPSGSALGLTQLDIKFVGSGD
jgi:hypothetical protein